MNFLLFLISVLQSAFRYTADRFSKSGFVIKATINVNVLLRIRFSAIAKCSAHQKRRLYKAVLINSIKQDQHKIIKKKNMTDTVLAQAWPFSSLHFEKVSFKSFPHFFRFEITCVHFFVFYSVIKSESSKKNRNRNIDWKFGWIKVNNAHFKGIQPIRLSGWYKRTLFYDTIYWFWLEWKRWKKKLLP